jgi:hypothetical protein
MFFPAEGLASEAGPGIGTIQSITALKYLPLKEQAVRITASFWTEKIITKNYKGAKEE